MPSHWSHAVFSIDTAHIDLGWKPQLGLEGACGDSYRWFAEGGSEQYAYDFAGDEAILAMLEAP